MLIENPKMTPQNLNIINVLDGPRNASIQVIFIKMFYMGPGMPPFRLFFYQKLAVDLNPIFAFQACSEIFEVKAKKVR
jgi:hypothetical protein